MIELLFYSTLAGAMIPLGGWLASMENIRSDWLRNEFRHGVIAFGGGALLSAVTLVLIPQGREVLSVAATLAAVAAGAAVMALLDLALARSKSHRAQLVAMLSDFVPEAVALGAMLVADPRTAPLLALMIALQNLPEGFNAFRETQQDGGISTGSILRRFVMLGLVGPGAALVGYAVLADRPELTGALMCVGGGGILYLMFQDIAPQVPLQNRFGPPLGAVAGFLLGLAGDMLIG